MDTLTTDMLNAHILLGFLGAICHADMTGHDNQPGCLWCDAIATTAPSRRVIVLDTAGNTAHCKPSQCIEAGRGDEAGYGGANGDGE